jgi:hypothetical protein
VTCRVQLRRRSDVSLRIRLPTGDQRGHRRQTIFPTHSGVVL